MPKKSVKKKRSKKKSKSDLKSYFLFILKNVFNGLKFILTIPFYILKGIIWLTQRNKKIVESEKVQKKRKSLNASYSKLKIIEGEIEKFNLWEKKIKSSDSVIGIILGARGTGKTALALKCFENLYSKNKTKLYAIGFKKNEMPSWVEIVDSIDKIKNNAHILIDEGGILFNSRKSMSSANKLLGELMLIARHKNLSILFISQNSSNLDVNILRQADYLMLKPSSLLQKNFERKIIKNLYIKLEKKFSEYQTNKGLTYIHSDSFEGFVSNDLPSFWNNKISKSFR